MNSSLGDLIGKAHSFCSIIKLADCYVDSDLMTGISQLIKSHVSAHTP